MPRSQCTCVRNESARDTPHLSAQFPFRSGGSAAAEIPDSLCPARPRGRMSDRPESVNLLRHSMRSPVHRCEFSSCRRRTPRRPTAKYLLAGGVNGGNCPFANMRRVCAEMHAPARDEADALGMRTEGSHHKKLRSSVKRQRGYLAPGTRPFRVTLSAPVTTSRCAAASCRHRRRPLKPSPVPGQGPFPVRWPA